MSKLGTAGNFPEKAEEVLARILRGCWFCKFFIQPDNVNYLAKALELEFEIGKTAGLEEASALLGTIK